jgi:hypothetical protein
MLQSIGWQSINLLAIPAATAAILLVGWGGMAGRRRPAVA